MDNVRIIFEETEVGQFKAKVQIYCAKWFTPVGSSIGIGDTEISALNDLIRGINTEIYMLETYARKAENELYGLYMDIFKEYNLEEENDYEI